MKSHHVIPLQLAAAFALLTAPITICSAQTTAAAPEEVEILAVYRELVSATRGFVAASALANAASPPTSGFSAAYSVLTRDYRALSLTTRRSAQQWTTGFNESGTTAGRTSSATVSASAALSALSNQQQIGFSAYYDYGSYNLERFDFAVIHSLRQRLGWAAPPTASSSANTARVHRRILPGHRSGIVSAPPSI